MKTFISAMIMVMLLLISLSACSQSTASTGSDSDATVTQQVKITGQMALASQSATEGNFFAENWGALLMGLLGFYDLIARLTPTNKDNTVVTFLSKLLNVIIPNLKKGGGVF